MNVAITGAFGYSGRVMAERLLERGDEVITLTNSPERQNPFQGAVRVYPFNFDQPKELVKSLKGVDTLINTYWVRFNHKNFNHSEAVQNSFKLFEAAKEAGLRKIVHVSITNPDLNSELEYFRGKAEIEEKLKSMGMSYSILRPAVIFGRSDILINNMAWFMRRLPVMGVFGDGSYRIQLIHVDDFADLAVREIEGDGHAVIDAIGPETYTYRELLKTIGRIIGKKRPIVSIPVWLGYWGCRLIGNMVGDVIITRQEIKGLTSGLLYTDCKPAGRIKLSEWVEEHAKTLGLHYASELKRRKDLIHSYAELDGFSSRAGE